MTFIKAVRHGKKHDVLSKFVTSIFCMCSTPPNIRSLLMCLYVYFVCYIFDRGVLLTSRFSPKCHFKTVIFIVHISPPQNTEGKIGHFHGIFLAHINFVKKPIFWSTITFDQSLLENFEKNSNSYLLI